MWEQPPQLISDKDFIHSLWTNTTTLLNPAPLFLFVALSSPSSLGFALLLLPSDVNWLKGRWGCAPLTAPPADWEAAAALESRYWLGSPCNSAEHGGKKSSLQHYRSCSYEPAQVQLAGVGLWRRKEAIKHQTAWLIVGGMQWQNPETLNPAITQKLRSPAERESFSVSRKKTANGSKYQTGAGEKNSQLFHSPPPSPPRRVGRVSFNWKPHVRASDSSSYCWLQRCPPAGRGTSAVHRFLLNVSCATVHSFGFKYAKRKDLLKVKCDSFLWAFRVIQVKLSTGSFVQWYA